jgi:hypothetical protein
MHVANDKRQTTNEGTTMSEYKITISGQSGTISMTVRKTEKGARGTAQRIANEAFYGEVVEITVVAVG